VTPGFVDIHTHYDGQAVWADRLTPSSWHGVTTVLAGNCGVGFAPCRPDDHELLIRLMEGVEDIPGVVLADGLDWSWETFPQFLDALEARPHDIDLAVQVPHGAVRVYAMGERGANREPATAADVAEMARLARSGVEAGALGFSTSRTLNHRSSDGRPTPTLTAAEDELLGVAAALGRSGRGVLQVVSDFADARAEFGMLRRLVEGSGRPLSVSVVQDDRRPEQWRDLLAWIGEAARAGWPMRGQVCGRPVGIVLGLECTLSPLVRHRAYRALARLPLAERVARLRDPEVRHAILTEEVPDGDGRLPRMLADFSRIFPLGDPPDYEPRPETSLAAEAARRGRAALEIAYDSMLENEGRGLLYLPFLNYSQGTLEPSLEMMKHPDTVLGLGDGGAHLGTISDASFPTTMLAYWTRDRRGERLSVPWVVRAHARDTAMAVGLEDRGLLAPGYKADVNLIDYDGLRLQPPRVVYDLPAGGRRLVQTAVGYRATIVSGRVVYRDGEPTGALPGRLVRGARSAPPA
jgi:N-acyl-D-aspartate/D-glutamate deacylase